MASKQELRDRGGNIIGKIEDRGSIIYAKDRGGNTLGYFLPRENKTRDRHGNMLTFGNTLATLIMSPRK